ncbi:putative reactive intermediate deaminase TdcF [subsurface metagenome]
MNQKIIDVKGVTKSSAPISNVIQAGNFIYTAGQIPVDLKTGIPVKGTIEEKAKKTLENLKLVLEAAGAKLADVVKITVFVSNLEYVSRFNKIYKTYFPNQFPVRSCVQVSRLAYGVEFEVEAVAYVGKE